MSPQTPCPGCPPPHPVHSAPQAKAAEPAIVNAWSTKSTVPFFRVGNYAPVLDELTTFDLPVDGAIPRELNGWYLRNGRNPRHDTPHWFAGDGMIHGVRLENGRATWYRNRWVRTESFGKPVVVYNTDGTRNLHASLANTSVVSHAGKTLALVESSLPYQITNEKRNPEAKCESCRGPGATCLIRATPLGAGA
jgi:carotenoid cleavage dioxygenase-like enzyme